MLNTPGVRNGAILIQDEARKTTTIVLTKPRAGQYTLTGHATAVRTAEALPAPRIRVRLTRRPALEGVRPRRPDRPVRRARRDRRPRPGHHEQAKRQAALPAAPGRRVASH